MHTSPNLSNPVKCRRVETAAMGDALLGAGLSPTVIRLAGHLPYFKIGSGLMLAQPLSLTGVFLMTLAYSALCFGASRWVAVRHAPVTCAIGLLAAMLPLALLIGTFFSLAPAHVTDAIPAATDLMSQLLPMLGLLLPVCGGFLAAQLLIRPARGPLA